MSRRKRRQPQQGETSGWMTTYGDLVTLLLTFFVLLFAFSTIDAQKWQALVASFAGNTGILEGGKAYTQMPGVDNGSQGDQIADKAEEYINSLNKNNDNQDVDKENNIDEFVQLYKNIGGYLKENDIPAEVEISREHTEILIRFKDSLLFDTGEADIRDDATAILSGIVGVLKEYDNAIDGIRVDGHADSRPINTYLYPTNWDLSAKRSVNVVRYFVERHGISPSKLSAAAYAEYHPIDSNDSPGGMARNRRVEIYIARTVGEVGTIDLEEGESER